MTKRVFIIHGWGGYPQESWFPYLKQKLEQKGYVVHIPAMPHTNHPTMEEWIPFLSQSVGTPDSKTFLIGHSIGCQTILRYLETVKVQIGGIILVAGFVHLALDENESPEIAKPWLKAPLHWEKIKAHTKNTVAIFSDDDQWVPVGDAQIFKEKLGAKIIVEKKQGHFTDMTQLPIVMREMEKMRKR